MAVLKGTGRFSVMGVSAAGGVFHNMGSAPCSDGSRGDLPGRVLLSGTSDRGGGDGAADRYRGRAGIKAAWKLPVRVMI